METIEIKDNKIIETTITETVIDVEEIRKELEHINSIILEIQDRIEKEETSLLTIEEPLIRDLIEKDLSFNISEKLYFENKKTEASERLAKYDI